MDKAKKVLEYGCGKAYYYKEKFKIQGKIVPPLKEYWGVNINLYDPCYEKFSKFPKAKVDLSICIDVLEHIPQEDIDKNTQLVPGIDGQKMSKSYDNIIPIFGDEKFIKKQIMSIVTDSTPVDQPKDLNSPLYKLFTLFLTEKEKKVLENKFLSPGLQYGKVKQDFFDVVMEYFRPFRDKRAYLSNNMDYVLDHLNSGSEKATLVADQIISKVRSATGLKYFDK